MEFGKIFKTIKRIGKITKKKIGSLSFGFLINRKKKVGILGFMKRIPNLIFKKKDPSGLLYKKMGKRKRVAVLGVSVVLLFAAGFAVAGVIGSFSTGDLNKGLVGHWSLDSAHLNSTTNRVDDISGYGNHGTNSGASLTTDRHGQANGAMSFNGEDDYTSFDGTSDYVDLGDINQTEGIARITASAWIYTTANAVNYEGILTKSANAASIGTWALIHNGNSIRFGVYTSSVVNVDAGVNILNGWHHVVGVYDGANAIVYIDGEEKNSGFQTGNINTNDLTVKIGRWTNVESGLYDQAFNGQISNVKIYDRALSGAEVRLLYDKGR